MKYILLLLLIICCGETEQEPKDFRERNIIVCACNNPGSIWHLSECNDECTKRNYTGEARCECISDVQCEENRSASNFIRRACGMYYR